MKRIAVLSALLVAAASAAHAGSLHGVVEAEGMASALPDARVIVQGTTLTATTDIDGAYRIDNIPDGEYRVKFSAEGFSTIIADVAVAGDAEQKVALIPTSVLSEEVIVTVNRAQVRESPVAFTNVTRDDIRGKYTTQDTPDLVKAVPGVFTRTSGLGESDLMVRGLDSEHVQVLINNVPVNDPESQVVYWSNWTGLSGNAADIQVQRGVGSSLYGSGAFGGSVNIETDNFSAQPRIGVNTTYGSMRSGTGNYIGAIDYSTGFFASSQLNLYLRYERKAGDSYIEGTKYDGHSFYVGFLAAASEKHSLTLNLHGAPQQHNQAANVQDPELLEKFGRTWNRRNHPYQENYFFKPVFEIHHDWTVSTSSFLNTTVFATSGEGGGMFLRNDKVNDTTGAIESIHSGTFAANRNYTTNSIFNNSWKNDSVNNHKQFGFNTSYKNVVNRYFTVVAGGEVRDWEARHYSDSFNFEFGDEGPGKPATVVPEVERRYDYDGDVLFGSLYLRAQLSPIPDKLTIMLDGQESYNKQTVTERAIRQYDFFNRKWTDIWARSTKDLIENWDASSGTATATVRPNPAADDSLYERDFTFFQPKFGVNYNVTDSVNVFTNYSIAKKEPKVGDWYFRSGVPASEDEQNIQAETLQDFEIGAGYRSQSHGVTVNVYEMRFEDKITGITDSNNNRKTLNVGNAKLRGAELSYRYAITRHFGLLTSLAYSQNKWDSVNGDVSKIFGLPAADVIGKHVPGAPERQAYLELSYHSDTWNGYLADNYWDKYYVLYDNSTVAGLREDGTLPSFNEVNMGFGYNFAVSKGRTLSFMLRANNLLGRKQYVDASYATDFGRDGKAHLGVTQSAERTYYLTAGFSF
ncbi:MAG: TonB-dependent receptor [Candidatus Schekmanbacteria bacterium]|nr:TonB-dependent receptor [Candidatus Schekmanbacteria bacterium]